MAITAVNFKNLHPDLQIMIQKWHDEHPTLNIDTDASLLRVWARAAGLTEKQYWQLTQLDKVLLEK